MNSETIMKLVDAYAQKYLDGYVEAQSDFHTPARAAVVTAIEALTKDAERYHWLRDQHWVEPEARFRLGLSDTENGSEYENELNQAIDAAIAAQKEQV